MSGHEKDEFCKKLGAVGVIDRREFDHWGKLPRWSDELEYGVWLKGARAFGAAFWKALGEKKNPTIVFEHPGEITLPTSCFMVETGGMVVICAGTTGYNATLDLRYHWMRQKRLQGSHFANDDQAKGINELVDRRLVDPCLSRTFAFDDTADVSPADARQPAPVGQHGDPRQRAAAGAAHARGGEGATLTGRSSPRRAADRDRPSEQVGVARAVGRPARHSVDRHAIAASARTSTRTSGDRRRRDRSDAADRHAKSPKVHDPRLNHIGLWVDDLPAAVAWSTSQGVRFTPGGIRKGAAGHDVCFIHPKGNDAHAECGEGVLIELVQAPPDLVAVRRVTGG